MSLANSLKSLGFDIEYIFGIKSIELLIKHFFIFNKKEHKKKFFITWGIYNFLPLPRKRILSFMHGFPSFNQQDLFRYYLFRIVIILNKIRRIRTISVSKFSHSILRDIYKIETNLIRNSLPYEYLESASNNELNKDIDVIFIGRANSFKLPIFIIGYLELLAKSGLNILIIGNGNSRDKYLKLNNQTKIKFYDFIDYKNVLGFLKRSKYFISCSDSEPFGLVFLEALICGCRIISPRSGGILEISSFFPKNFSYLFNFYEDEVNAKDIMLGLDYSYKKVSSKSLNPIKKIINKEFNPIIHAKKVIEFLNIIDN